MKVAAVQFKARPGDPDASRDALVALATEAADGTDLLVLPEMAVTGYRFEDAEAAREVAEPAGGPTFEALSPIARQNDCWLVCGFPEDAGGKLYNSALVIDPRGALHTTYRKTCLYKDDHTWATPGDGTYPLVDTPRGTFTVGICMDLNDDAFVAWIQEKRPRALAFPTNWVDEDENVWSYWAWRLIDTGCALVAANTYGAEGDLRFRGESAILDDRTILAAGPPDGDEILRAVLT